MKKYIREIMNDLMRKKAKDYVPPIPKASADAPTVDLNTAPAPALPGDLNNQELSNDPAQRVRQLDYQAQRSKESQGG